MDLSVILVNFNVYEDIKACIGSFCNKVKNIKYEIFVVDNNSSDQSIYQITKDFPTINLILLKENRGFGAANNAALKVATGDFILFMNPDILLIDNSPELILEYLKCNPGIGAAGPVQLKPGSGIERYYSFFPSLYSRLAQEFGFYTKAPIMKYRFNGFWDSKIEAGMPFEVDWIIGSCLMIRRKIYEDLGGFDEAFFLYEEEVELQYRMNSSGWKSIILPYCKVLHNHHSSTSKLGIMFILYHEYRSRIVYSAKRYVWPISIVRKLLALSSLIFRSVFFTITDFNTLNTSIKRLYLYFDLGKLVIYSRKKLLKSRFDFDNYAEYFMNTNNAKL